MEFSKTPLLSAELPENKGKKEGAPSNLLGTLVLQNHKSLWGREECDKKPCVIFWGQFSYLKNSGRTRNNLLKFLLEQHPVEAPYQAISGENFSQSEYVAFGAISQFAFPPLAKAIHRAFDYVNLSNLCSKQAFHFINLSNVGFIIESQSVRIHISFRRKPISKLRFEAENSTDPYAFARIN